MKLIPRRQPEKIPVLNNPETIVRIDEAPTDNDYGYVNYWVYTTNKDKVAEITGELTRRIMQTPKHYPLLGLDFENRKKGTPGQRWYATRGKINVYENTDAKANTSLVSKEELTGFETVLWYRAMLKDETAYLLSNEANKKRLELSKKQLEEGNTVSVELTNS